MKGREIRRWIRRVWLAAGICLMAWMWWSVQAHGVTEGLLTSSASVTVRTADRATLFLPAAAPSERVGFALLPGGLIHPHAYVPFVRALADAGVPAAIVELPFRQAPTESSRDEVWRRVEAVRAAWGPGRPLVLAGHSRGAALAGRFASEHPEALAGLVLIGTTHPRDQDLSGVSFPVLKVLGSRDCVADPADARANAHRLPPGTQWVEIAGGNHAQFGHYGSQFNDCQATISREAQQLQAREAVLELLGRIDAR